MAAANKSGNPVLDNAGIVASLFALVLLVGFVGAILNSATSHDAHGTPPAAGPAHH